MSRTVSFNSLVSSIDQAKVMFDIFVVKHGVDVKFAFVFNVEHFAVI